MGSAETQSSSEENVRLALATHPSFFVSTSSLERATMVRLITQNLLSCPSSACSYPANFPLSLKDVETIELVETEYNPDFIRRFLPRLEWNALVQSAAELGNTDLPKAPPNLTNSSDASEELLKALHHVLLEIQVKDGAMVCPSCAHIFYIKDGIPNMLLAENEIRK